MKKLITAVIITTCLALGAAVWPQNATVEESTPASPNTRRNRPRTACHRGQIGSGN